MTYRDRAFCSDKTCVNTNCDRLITDKTWELARLWWGDDSAPILQSDFRDTTYCVGYVAGNPSDDNITPYSGAPDAK